MATLQLRVTLEGRGISEATLRELQQWLKDAGIRAQLEVEEPAPGELGGKVIGVLLIIPLTAEGVHLPVILHQLDHWQQRSPESVKVILHSNHSKEIHDVLESQGIHAEVGLISVISVISVICGSKSLTGPLNQNMIVATYKSLQKTKRENGISSFSIFQVWIGLFSILIYN